MSDDDASDVGLLKTLASIASLLAVAFSSTGFLSLRTYLNTLGVPLDAEPSVDAYLQNGGRVFFTLVAHSVPIALTIGMVVLAGDWIRGKYPAFAVPFARANIQYGLICLLGLGVFYEEVMLTGTEAILSEKSARTHLPSIAGILFVEVALALMLTLLWYRLRSDKAATSKSLARRVLCFVAILVASATVMLFPMAFGATAMVPPRFENVVIVTDEQTAPETVQGVLVFSDANSFFVWSPGKVMVQVPRSKVRQIRYQGTKSLNEVTHA